MIKPDDIKSYHVAKEHDDKARNKALQERRGFVSGVHAKALEKVARSHNPKEADIDSTKAAANFLDNFDRLDKNTRLFFGKASKFLTKTKAQANQLEPQTKNFAQDVLVKTSPKSNPRSRKSSDEDIIKLSSADVAKLSPADVEENIARFTINQVRSLTIKQVSELNAITIINLSTDKIDALYEIAPLTQIQNSEIVNKALKDMKKKQIDAIFPKFFKGFHVDIWQDNIRSNTYEVLHLYLELSKIKKEIYQQNSGFFGNLFIRGPLYYLENINFRLNRLIDKGSTEVDDLKPVASGIGQFAKGFVNFIFWHLQLPFFLLMRIQQISQNPDMMYLPKIAWQEIKNISMSLRYLYKFLLVVTLFVPTAFLSLLLKGVSLVIPDFLKSSVEVVETPAGDEKQKRRYLNDLVNALEKQQPNKNIDPESLKKIKSFKDSYRMENFNLEVLKEDVIEIIGFDPEEVIQQYYASKATQPTTKSETVTPPDSKQFFAVTQRQALPTVTPSKESPPTIINEGEVETNKRKLGG